MALIKCPNCGTLVSDKADACPVCGKSVASILAGNDGGVNPGAPVNQPDNIPPVVNQTPYSAPSAPSGGKKGNPLLIPLLIGISALLVGLIIVVVLLISKSHRNNPDAAPAEPAVAESGGYVGNPTLRYDIARPAIANHETVAFPLNRTFISSGGNFILREASGTYFAYVPSEHWGLYMFHNDKRDFWTTRYLYCTGWDSRTNTLTLTAYSLKGEYDGEMSGTFTPQGGRYVYNCTFTNYRGKRATYRIMEDVFTGGSAPVQSGGRQIYSSAYDGFVVMREGPSAQSYSIGRFLNGPTGATLLAEMGGWTQINYNGLIGWVPSRYLSSSPTLAYTGTATADWVEGIWSRAGGDMLLIYNNGTWEFGDEFASSSHGKWLMQNNEIKFIPTWRASGMNGFAETLQIYQSSNKLGDFNRVQYMTEGGYMEFGLLTRSEFIKARQHLYKEIERGH